MSGVRSPVVAGSFYPGSAEVLAATVDGLLREAAATVERCAIEPGALRGVIVPHAGYIYSGPVAAAAYALLAKLTPPPVVVVLGPSHFVPLTGLVVATDDAWATPLGQLPLASEVRQGLLRGGARSSDLPHRDEHSIEVQLPFLQRCLPRVPIVPVAVGQGSPRAGAELLDGALPDGALLVVSTDLSHYHDATTARRLDARTAAAVEERAIADLGPADACGYEALCLALAWATAHDLRLHRLDLRNSADTAGDASRVVGYGAFAFVESAPTEAAME
jgi:AmmeMemoRadiSam system protein B